MGVGVHVSASTYGVGLPIDLLPDDPGLKDAVTCRSWTLARQSIVCDAV
jgi:hypothetical protein